MLELSSKILLLVAALPTTAFLVYWLLKSDEEEENEKDEGQKVMTSRHTLIEMKIPRKSVGAVIGRQGQKIKELQETSGARINFKDDSGKEDEDRTILIRGTPESAQTAECLIRKILADQPIKVTIEIHVPAYSIGRIIGHNGDTVRQISRSTNTKIYIDRTRDSYRDDPRPITITGTLENIEIAKGMINELIEEEEQFRAKTAVSAANREPRSKQKAPKAQYTTDSNDSLKLESLISANEFWDRPTSEQTVLAEVQWPAYKEYVEVYVSAVANPGIFWVQLVASASLQLDKLTEEMSAFYSRNFDSQELFVTDVRKGHIVASPFEGDSLWYRARVMDIDGDQLDLYFIDYGDSNYSQKNSVRMIQQEYLYLPAQAIECRLANVKPKGDGWTEAATEEFEQWTHCARWKVLMSKNEKKIDAGDGEATSPSPLFPHLTLMDTNRTVDFNINNELVLKGYAEWIDPQ
ncbi:hypothetical protein CHS0354_037029 [Potamilus streckersoni]|uniref:Tudor domain-containing protein n=1 Tax=Potamilus streckersoni TaxID=2493646 RepID=A0AAE0VXA8_9BIVA|nr:hypothetical protein CHS0354_037029 [Potamilus streckersoni]